MKKIKKKESAQFVYKILLYLFAIIGVIFTILVIFISLQPSVEERIRDMEKQINQTSSYKINEEIPLTDNAIMEIRSVTLAEKFIREGLYFNYTCSPKANHKLIKMEFWRKSKPYPQGNVTLPYLYPFLLITKKGYVYRDAKEMYGEPWKECKISTGEEIEKYWCNYYSWIETKLDFPGILLECGFWEIPEDDSIAKFRMGIGDKPERWVDILVE